MANFAVIKDGKVENLIVSESKDVAEEATGLTCVEYTDVNPAFIGLGYDGTTFEQPIVEEPEEETVELPTE
jgi:hypothetical protein